MGHCFLGSGRGGGSRYYEGQTRKIERIKGKMHIVERRAHGRQRRQRKESFVRI